MADYVLPDLPYDYSALEPHISGQIMELHHDKHHQAYVTGANTALEQLAEARHAEQLGTVNLLEKNLAFNLAGHVNHSVFWPNMSPDGGDKPDGDLAAAIDEYFGSFDGFRAQFTAVALGIQGSGWAILAWDSLGQRLIIEQRLRGRRWRANNRYQKSHPPMTVLCIEPHLGGSSASAGEMLLSRRCGCQRLELEQRAEGIS